MDIRSLGYFKEIAELEHITRASEVLHVAQPALSRTLSRLEKELGVDLFDRKGKNISLNQYGEILLKHTKRVLQVMKDIQHEIDDAKSSQDRTVTVFVNSASKLLPELVMTFKSVYPFIRIRIVHTDFVADHNYDLSIYSSSEPILSDCSEVLIQEDILIALPDSHYLSRRKSIGLYEVASEEFICLQRSQSLRKIIDNYCRLAGFEPSVVLESDSPEIVRGLVQAGVGISFIPSVTWKGMSTENITLLPIHSPECKRYISLSWHEDGYLSKAAILFKEFIINYFRSL